MKWKFFCLKKNKTNTIRQPRSNAGKAPAVPGVSFRLLLSAAAAENNNVKMDDIDNV